MEENIDMKSSVVKVFEKRPENWGLRGDPYLWDDLEKCFVDIFIPYSEEDFRKEIYDNFEKLTGFKINSKEDIYVSKYVNGGISSGIISSEFWLNTALPLLIRRLKQLNHDSY